jgi:hypothetical protein
MVQVLGRVTLSGLLRNDGTAKSPPIAIYGPLGHALIADIQETKAVPGITRPR